MVQLVLLERAVGRPSLMLSTKAIRSETGKRPKVYATKLVGNLEVSSRAGKVSGVRAQQPSLIWSRLCVTQHRPLHLLARGMPIRL